MDETLRLVGYKLSSSLSPRNICIFISTLLFLFTNIQLTSSCLKPRKPGHHSHVPTKIEISYTGDITKSDVKAHRKVVVCYLGTWAVYREMEGAYDITKHFNPNLCTHLIYTFAGLNNETNELKPLDPHLDLSDNYGRGWYSKATEFKSSYPHLKVLLAVGGWNEGSQKYSIMVENPDSRKAFVNSAVNIIRNYGFDGIDLDWEFPARRGGRPEDKKLFTLLVQELREEFDKYGLMITAAFGASKEIADISYELPELSSLLDQVHLMCYDYHGSWDNRTYHNSPLDSEIGDLSVRNSVEYFILKGVPADKLVLGVPLYGRTFLLLDGNQPGNALNKDAQNKGFQGPYTKENGFMGYNEICQKVISGRGDWATYWDARAKVPFMRDGSKWVSFDSMESLHDKVAFAMAKKLKGIMVWSIDTDDFLGACSETHQFSQNAKYPLLRSINCALAQTESNPNEYTTTTDVPTRTIVPYKPPPESPHNHNTHITTKKPSKPPTQTGGSGSSSSLLITTGNYLMNTQIAFKLLVFIIVSNIFL